MANRKVPKAQNIGRGWPQSWRELAKLLMRDIRYDIYRYFTWMLEDILKGFGLNIGETPPEDAHSRIFELSGTFAQCVAESEPFTDILGPIYQDVGQGNEYMGQFFTPQNVSDMMAMMMIGEDERLKEGNELLTACDPTSGSAVMMLSAAKYVLKTFGEKGLSNLSVTCVDLDYRCALMSAVQLLGNCYVHQLELGEIVVIHGNSLIPENQWRQIAHATRKDIVVGIDVPPAESEFKKKQVRVNAEHAQIDLFSNIQNEHKEAA